ncbi:substrate-binding domain-containing protein [Nocardioides sp. Root151]|uniref:substrate-binding domain-containing protein n=1 Tax=Nocardioides sp. Root151 TaxID=1736475 RepID=UPI0007026323|nr:substrate-binding domain-containing protein [Nocardioides sp. Root151]KQZ67354.1 hypothetical protein ASD66_20590 [Nocardioides sp. Root151]
MGSGTHAREREKASRFPLWIGLLVLVLIIGVVAAVLWRARSEDSSCGSTSRTTVAAAPDIAPALTRAAEAMADEVDCVEVQVVAMVPAEALNALVARDPSAPDLWVPDSPVWIKQLSDAGVRSTVLSEAIASSPVALAGGPSAAAPGSWFDALSTGRVVVQDPTKDGPSAAALAAPRAESSATGASADELTARMVPLAQQYGARTAKPADEVLAAISTTSKQLVPVTEQHYLAAKRQNGALSFVVPDSGTLLLQYPVVSMAQVDDDSTDASGEFVSYLEGRAGQDLLSEADFRKADGTALAAGVGFGDVTALPQPNIADVQSDLRRWTVLTVPTSMLAVVDASGSMDFETGDGTRMELAVDAARRALSEFPGNARVGLWSFSIDQGGPGVDYKQLAPLRALGEGDQGARLVGAIEGLVDRTTGGTGLYDTTLAAYREAIKKYDERYFNSVVILSDGANDDPGSIGLSSLVKTLRAEADMARPVRIIAIGISEDADMTELTRIAEATGGSAYPARDPRDILAVISQALLAR